MIIIPKHSGMNLIVKLQSGFSPARVSVGSDSSGSLSFVLVLILSTVRMIVSNIIFGRIFVNFA